MAAAVAAAALHPAVALPANAQVALPLPWVHLTLPFSVVTPCSYNGLQHGKHSCTPEDGKRDAKVGAGGLLGRCRVDGFTLPPGTRPGWRPDHSDASHARL